MATGDQADFTARLRAALPSRWFGDTAPVLTGLLSGLASAWAALYALLLYTRLQTRIATATGAFLDMIGLDYFAGRLMRRPGEPDASFSVRIRREIVRPRATRAAVVQALTDLTGRTPVIFEPADATDTGGYGSTGMTAGTGLGYGIAGGYGSMALPYQFFVQAYRAIGGGIPSVGGYYTGTGWAGGGYGVGALEYGSPSMTQGAISDADIYAAVAGVIPAAAIGWTRISS